jgi:opacity protein-like surface antigen
MKKQWFVILLASVVFMANTPQILLSQTPPVPASVERASAYWSRFKFEIGTAVSFQKSLVDSSYFHQYSPPFLSGAYESQANQTIKIGGKDGWGFNVGFAYFPLTNFGIQLLVDYAKPKLSGNNTDYDVLLNYAMSFEANPPYPNTFEYTYGWPDTAGYLTEICLSLNGLVRLPISRKLAFGLSGGLTYFHVDSLQTGLAYSYYWYEDGWFWGRTFDVKCKIGATEKLGLNIGAELSWVLFSNMCFVLDARYFACPSSTLPMDIIDEGLVTPPPPPYEEIAFNEIRATMNLKEITINPSFYRINLGLKYLF